MKHTRLLWLASATLAALGTALVFAAVTVDGLFVTGVVLVVLAAIAALAAGVLETLRAGD